LFQTYTYALADDGGAQKTFALSGSGNADRIDRIILRLDLSDNARTIKMHTLQGTPAPNPLPPALTNTALIKEISLCRVWVGASASLIVQEDIADERLDEEVCGILAPEALRMGSLDERYASKGDVEDLLTNAVMWADVENSLGQTEAGKALDARQGKALGDRLEAVEAGKAEAGNLTAVLAAAGWSGKAPFTQTVQVAGMLDTDNPIVDMIVDDDPKTAVAQMEAYGFVGRMRAEAGALKVWCYEDKPEIDLPLQLKTIRSGGLSGGDGGSGNGSSPFDSIATGSSEPVPPVNLWLETE